MALNLRRYFWHLEGDEPAASKVEAFLAKALPAVASNPETTAHALVPLDLRRASVQSPNQRLRPGFVEFVHYMKAQGVDQVQVTVGNVEPRCSAVRIPASPDGILGSHFWTSSRDDTLWSCWAVLQRHEDG